LALAASLAVAFVLGTRFPAVGPLGDGPQVAVKEEQPQTGSAATPDLAGDSSSATGRQPWQTLRLTPVSGASQEPIELRVVESDGDDARELAGRRSALSGQLLRGFEQEGFEVDRRERLVPIDLSDGRRVLVPIEEVDIRSPDVARL
jgi:hypothetical protein